MAFTMPPMAFMGSGALIVLVIAQGLIGGLIPTNIFSAAVEVVGDERLGGLAMGVIMVGQNAGMLVRAGHLWRARRIRWRLAVGVRQSGCHVSTRCCGGLASQGKVARTFFDKPEL